jgi:hypothetical protein
MVWDDLTWLCHTVAISENLADVLGGSLRRPAHDSFFFLSSFFFFFS